jgi:hypothetical protein
MGHQIIKEPGKDTYAVFSSFTDQWILWNASRDELLDYYADRAAKEARRTTARVLDLVDEDPRKAYYQFAMTFEEANAKSAECGPDLRIPEATRWEPGDPELAGALLGWLTGSGADFRHPGPGTGSKTRLAVRNGPDEPWQVAEPGDWVVREDGTSWLVLTPVQYEKQQEESGGS